MPAAKKPRPRKNPRPRKKTSAPVAAQSLRIKSEIVSMALTDLTPAPYNPRRIDDAAFNGLRASLREFGTVELVVWNKRTGNVVSGHQRVKALTAEGDDRTDVVVVDLPETREKALNITLNSPAVAGEFTDELQGVLAEIDDAILAEDLRLTALVVDADDVAPPPEILDLDMTDPGAEFWLSARGPLKLQVDVLEQLRDTLEGLDVDIVVSLGIVGIKR